MRMRARHLAIVAAGLAAPMLLLLGGPAAAVPIAPGGGGVADAETVTVTLTLAGASEKALEARATAVSTPGAAGYHVLSTPGQLREKFGAPAARVQKVSAWARSAGFTVGDLDPTGTRLTVTGTARAAKAAFGVGLQRTTREGVRVRTATATPRPPTTVAADVRAVTGLTQQVARPMNVRPAATPSAADDGQYCSTFWGQWNKASVPQKYPAGNQSNQLCGYNGAQLRSLYGLTSADTGAGQTIVIVGAYNNPTTLADANTTFARNGVPALAANKYLTKTYNTGNPGAADCDRSSWHAEQALDVQTVHTIAPAARIVYAAAADCTDLEATLSKVITDTSLDSTIVSNSWGILSEPSDTAYLTAANSMLARAAILGVGTYFASGDYGDNSDVPGGQPKTVSFPASSPWTTAVGGTTAGIGASNQTVFQTGWENAANTLTGGAWKRLNPAFVGGAGGGASARFDKPTWQKALPGTRRTVPDIAALADPYTGFFIGFTLNGQYQVDAFGGTSLATPIIASLAAVAQAKAGGDSTIGLLAPVLYAKAAAGKSTIVDTTHVAAGIWSPGISATLPRGDYLVDVDAGVQSLQTTSGYDPVTGLGTPGRTFLTDIVS
jgi:subtilase family serine protease